MAAEKIVYNYAEMQKVVDTINGIATSYKNAGDKFNTAFTDAVKGWEGQSKDRMMKLINGDVNTMLTKDIVSYIEGLATLLQENITQMQKADTQIANSIPETIK